MTNDDMSTKDDILRSSQPLRIPEAVTDAASTVQTQILVMLNDQNRIQAQTNATIFEKLDDAKAVAQIAAEAAKATGATAEAAHQEALGIKAHIDVKFAELNGTIASTKLDVEALKKKDGEREVAAITKAVKENAVKCATEGVWMMPKPTWRQLSIAGGVIAFLGSDRIIAAFKAFWHLADRVMK